MSDYDSTRDTLEHIAKVESYLNDFRAKLYMRAIVHDASKLQSPEKEAFDEVTPQLHGLTYGSEEYKASIAKLGPALEHHYRHNSHHPEHYPGGVDDMSLLDIIEMLCDWYAATQRHADGDMERSLRINADRFGIDRQLAMILANTAQDMGWIKGRRAQ